MNAVAKTTEHEAPAIHGGGDLVSIIAAVAQNPNADVDKLERLLAMKERIDAKEAERDFNTALNLAQAELRPVAADAANPQTRSRYASYLALDRAARPVYSRHGFSLSFNTADGAPADCVRVICYVAHANGHTRTYHVDMPADGKGAKGNDVMTKTHAAGAAMSYGQRYLLKLIFNISVGEDDDGNGANGPSAIVTAALAAIDECGTDSAKLDAWHAKNNDHVRDLPAHERTPIVRAYQNAVREARSAAR